MAQRSAGQGQRRSSPSPAAHALTPAACLLRRRAPSPAARDGSIYSYAVSYDWSHGHADYNPATARNLILLHATQEAEAKNRSKPATARR